MANTRNIEANFLNFKKMDMMNVLLTEFAEEHKKYVHWPKFVDAGSGLPRWHPLLGKTKKMSPTQMCVYDDLDLTL